VTLNLSRTFAAYLSANGVTLSAAAPAVRKGAKFTLPATGGEFDPTTGKGAIEAAGALVFASQRKKVPLRSIVVKANRAPLTAKVGGGQLKVATAASVAVKREGFGERLTAEQLRLSAKAATRLNKKLRPEMPFAANQAIGTLQSKTQPTTVTVLAQNRATLTPTADFLAKLKSLFVSLNPIAPAELGPGPVLSLPIISGSQIAPDGSQGTLRTGGELELLQLGGGQVFWHEQWLEPAASADSAEADLQPSPPYAGKQARAPVLSLSLAGAQISSDPGARTVTITGAPLTLEASSAAAMNQLFAQGKMVFNAGEAFGTVSATAQGQ
jgi:hypothetical protein